MDEEPSYWDTEEPDDHTGWIEAPDSGGNWLWVEMWSCACCVHKSGIAYVHKHEHLKDGCYETNGWLVSWEGSMPTMDDMGKPYIHAWKKVGLPAHELVDRLETAPETWPSLKNCSRIKPDE